MLFLFFDVTDLAGRLIVLVHLPGLTGRRADPKGVSEGAPADGDRIKLGRLRFSVQRGLFIRPA